MRAMILAAGLGTRLRPITEKIPKPLISINNKPLIFYSLNLLKRSGIKEVIINVHYLAEKIIKELGNGEDFGIKISYSVEEKLLGPGGGIKKCEEFLKGDTFVVINGDILIDVDLNKAIDFHENKKALATMVLTRNYGERFTRIGIDENKRIRKIGKVNDYIDLGDYKDDNFLFCGIHILEPKVFEFLKLEFSSIMQTAYPKMINNNLGVYGFVHNGHWADLGTAEDYEKNKKLVESGCFRYGHLAVLKN